MFKTKQWWCKGLLRHHHCFVLVNRRFLQQIMGSEPLGLPFSSQEAECIENPGYSLFLQTHSQAQFTIYYHWWSIC
jgi:hypothetical protein